jgi:hypothetical protein
MTILLEDVLTLLPSAVCVGIMIYFNISEILELNKIKKHREPEIKEHDGTFNENV